MIGLRYGGLMDMQQEMQEYGPWIILGIHVLIVLMAFKDDLFTGTLCLFIPGYSLYYLIAQSGRAFLCAFVCAMLLGLGEDSLSALLEVTQQSHGEISEWLSGNR